MSLPDDVLPRSLPDAGLAPDALVLLVGPAASGKSTWAAARVRPSAILSSDAFREMVADDAGDQAASADAFRLLHSAARARLARGLLTVVDATNLQASARRPLRQLAARFARPCVAVVFQVPLEVLLARNAARDRQVPEAAVRWHATLMRRALLELPGEGYTAILET